MKEIEQNVFDNLPSPLEKRIWERWIKQGKARVIPSKNGVKKCRNE
jgi:hypothetical protein